MSRFRYLKPDQVRAAIDQLDGKFYVAAMIQWRAGLRVSEVLGVTAADVDIEARTLTVQGGKGGKRRTVPLHGELVTLFRTAPKPAAGVPYVQCNRSTVFRRYVKVGIEGTHTLRHSAARHWLNSGRGLHQIQKVLGHSRLQTTLEYLELAAWDAEFMEGVE